MLAADDAVLKSIEDYVLHPDVVSYAFREALRLLNPDPADDQARRVTLGSEIAALESQLANLVNAIAMGAGQPSSVIAAVQERERRLQRLRAELSLLDGHVRLGKFEQQQLEQEMLQRLQTGDHFSDATSRTLDESSERCSRVA